MPFLQWQHHRHVPPQRRRNDYGLVFSKHLLCVGTCFENVTYMDSVPPRRWAVRPTVTPTLQGRRADSSKLTLQQVVGLEPKAASGVKA